MHFQSGHGAAIPLAGADALSANKAWLFGDDGDDDAEVDAAAGADADAAGGDHEDGLPPDFQVGFATAKGNAVQLDGTKMAEMNVWLFAGGGEDEEPLAAAASSAAAPTMAARAT